MQELDSNFNEATKQIDIVVTQIDEFKEYINTL